jgi:outer membrane protein assembly factor BamB
VNAADPLVIDNRVFISSGYRKGCAMVEIRDGSVETVWESNEFSSHFSSFVYADGYIYGNDGDANAHRGTFKCLDASTGEVMWEHRDGLGSLMIAGEYLLTVTERRRLAVALLTALEYTEVAACTLPKGLIWSPPVLAGGFIFIRGMNGELYAVRG